MRFKFERLTAERIPGAGKHHAEDVVSGVGGEVDLAMIIDKLRNHQRPAAPSLASAETADPALQPGDPGYRKQPFPEQPISRAVPRDDQRGEVRNTGFGLRR
jgi:hypothetical protein